MRLITAGSLQIVSSFLTGACFTSLGFLRLTQKCPERRKDEQHNLVYLCKYYENCSRHLLKELFCANQWICHLIQLSTGFHSMKEKISVFLLETSIQSITAVWSSSWFNKVGAPQKLMEYVHRYGNRQARLAATELLLTNMNILQDLVRVCDNRILVGIVRQTGISKDIWKTTTKSSHKCPDEKAIEMSLKSLLLSLPPSGVDECTRWFTKSAILSGTSAKQHKRSMSWNFGGDHGLSFAHTLTSMPADQVELFYLKALTRHSTVPWHCDLMVENGIIPLLIQELKSRPNSLKIKRQITHLLGNLAVDDITHPSLIDEGCLRFLHSCLISEDLSLSSLAARALANLDRDFTPDEVYEDGIYLLHPDTRHSHEFKADIVFVHGLRGGPLKTWRREGTSTPLTSRDCWPKAWLASDFPQTRLLMVEYDTSLSHWVSQCPSEPETQSMTFCSEELMHKLRKAGIGKRPVIWITHSMGGLLVKQLLLLASDSEEYRCMSDNSRGIIFYSTPHQGSIVASYSSQARYLLLPSVQVKELTQGSEFLSSLHKRFLEFLTTHPSLDCVSFGETVPMQLSWIFKSVLVSRDSADPGIGAFHSVDVNHIDVCKPTDRHDVRYREAAELIGSIINPIHTRK